MCLFFSTENSNYLRGVCLTPVYPQQDQNNLCVHTAITQWFLLLLKTATYSSAAMARQLLNCVLQHTTWLEKSSLKLVLYELQSLKKFSEIQPTTVPRIYSSLQIFGIHPTESEKSKFPCLSNISLCSSSGEHFRTGIL